MGPLRRSEKINVVYKNGVKDRISPALLGTLIDARQIERFERSDGWARVGVDATRGARRTKSPGEERRFN